MTERLLHNHPRLFRQPSLGKALNHRGEQERRGLQIEDRQLGALDRVADTAIGRRIREVAAHVGQSLGEPLEDVGVELLPRALDRLTGALHQLLYRPIVHREANDWTLQKAACFEPVKRPEGHHFGEISSDSERDEDVGGSTFVNDIAASVSFTQAIRR